MQEAGRKQVLQDQHEDTSMLGQVAQAELGLLGEDGYGQVQQGCHACKQERTQA